MAQDLGIMSSASFSFLLECDGFDGMTEIMSEQFKRSCAFYGVEAPVSFKRRKRCHSETVDSPL